MPFETLNNPAITVAAANATYVTQSVHVVDATRNGVVADGTTDDYAALAAIVDAATTGVTIINLPPGSVINMGTGSLAFDISKVRLRGDRTRLKWASGGGSSGYAIHLFSSVAYTSDPDNWGPALDGIIVAGGVAGTKHTGTGIKIGHATYTQNAQFSLSNGGVYGFVTVLEFIDNAWCIALDHFNCAWGDVTVPAGLTNFGERMIWRDSMIHDSVTLSLGSGEWHFSGISFDNAPIVVTGAAFFYGADIHFENPGNDSPGYRMLSVDATALATLTNVHVVINDPPSSDWEYAPFYVDSGNTTKGLVIQNLHAPKADFIKPAIRDAIRVLVAGGGRVDIAGVSTFSGTQLAYALAESMNLIRNGNAEAGTIAGWTKGAGGTYSANTSAGYLNRGTYSHKISLAASTNTGFYQTVPVSPGKSVWCQAWLRRVVATGDGTSSVQLDFLDSTGATISTAGYNSTGGGTDVAGLFSVYAPVPTGAVSVKFFTFTNGGSGGADIYLDDVIVNCA